jgi:hypothetical protein
LSAARALGGAGPLRAASVLVLITASAVAVGQARTAGLLASRSRVPIIISPKPGSPLQYELQTGPGAKFATTGGIDVSICRAPVIGGPRCVRPRVFDIDLYGPDGTTPNVTAVRDIRATVAYAICYVDAGTWESWRPDADEFPRPVLGKPNGWPGERWLDIHDTSVLLPIMAKRVQKCRQAGFEGVEFDNVDGFANDTGFPLTASEQLVYNRDLAGIAQRDGLAAGLKNDYSQVRELEPLFNFAVDESCWIYSECQLLEAFVTHHKVVFDVEYGLNPSQLRRYCSTVARMGISGLGKRLSLFALPWEPCG